MTKKKINIVLIVVVITLWGTVVYRSVNQYFFPNQIYITDSYKQINIDFKKALKDTFQLNNLIRDPFLDVNSVKEQLLSDNKVYRPSLLKVAKKENLPIAPIEWPQISYYGYIKSANKNEELVMIKVDNKLHKIKKNAEIQEFKVINVYKDSIVVKKQNEKRTISRKSSKIQNQHEE